RARLVSGRAQALRRRAFAGPVIVPDAGHVTGAGLPAERTPGKRCIPASGRHRPGCGRPLVSGQGCPYERRGLSSGLPCLGATGSAARSLPDFPFLEPLRNPALRQPGDHLVGGSRPRTAFELPVWQRQSRRVDLLRRLAGAAVQGRGSRHHHQTGVRGHADDSGPVAARRAARATGPSGAT
nr:hypothetical protein [Tanacetum cinerariifolium]